MTQRELHERYWVCKGSGDAWLGVFNPPTWHEQWAQDAYRTGHQDQPKRAPAQPGECL